MRAMILAAGLGTRMAPLSPGIPKPALPVLDRPLALRLIDSLAEQGVEAVIVNAHTQPEKLRAALRGAPIPVEISYEPSLLGSGGGIREARNFLTLDSSEPCLVLNADMCVAIDTGALLAAHRSRCSEMSHARRSSGLSAFRTTQKWCASQIGCVFKPRTDLGSSREFK